MIEWLLSTAIGLAALGLLYQGCLWLGSKFTRHPPKEHQLPYWHDRSDQPGSWIGVAIFFFVMVGLPIMAVLWGYATGRLPAR